MVPAGAIIQGMERRIVDFGVDEAGDRYAVLECGHRQHVRHRPPFINRPWTETEEGRRSMLGRMLPCARCAESGDWFALALGDALTAHVRLKEIEDAAQELWRGAGEPANMAVMTRHDTEHSLACRVTVYFSPAAASLAERFGAAPTPRPARANLDLLVGAKAAWRTLFPDGS